ncbi:MAG TPA: apolipoprotein N-acyltransferase [Kiritimatiellia bacterium]|nr:apolipoprotein N-acyltransferase [Kiritimatiellia bacterium]
MRERKEVQEVLRSRRGLIRPVAGEAKPVRPPGWMARISWPSAVVSGLLLSSSFAPLEWSGAAWVALIPLILAVYGVPPRWLPGLGFACGAAYWLTSIFWLTRVTVAGWLLLSLYCALYAIPFAMVVGFWLRRYGSARFLPNLGCMVAGTAVWCGSEFARSTWFTGFPWNPLGVSQVDNAGFLSMSTWGGVYALSALVVWVNLGIGLTLLRYLSGAGAVMRRPHPEVMMAMTAVIVAFGLGLRSVREPPRLGPPSRIALIQTNIPQDEKWDEEKFELIYTRLAELTSNAIDFTQPDLVIWPETALPDDIRFSESSYALVLDLVQRGAPILVGSMDMVFNDDGTRSFFNSSFLFDPQGKLIDQYDKQHLVMIGEYVPWAGLMPFFRAWTPIQESFSPGRESTVMQWKDGGPRFSVLICFEDTMAYLGRNAVRKGARFLVNQTNNAWFDPSSASRQHMAISRLRAAENRVPLIRATNTGVTCAIDAYGRITDVLSSDDGDLLVHGFLLVDVFPAPSAMPLTFYTRYGDVFAKTCLAMTVVLMWPAAGSFRRRGGIWDASGHTDANASIMRG